MTTLQRPRVEKVARTVVRDGKELHWKYIVPLERGGALFGWRETQPEALEACSACIREMREKGWT